MHSLTLDAQSGLRRLITRPLFSAVAVITLALGVGAATTIFSVIQSVLLDPVPYADSDRVVVIQIHDVIQKRPASRTTFEVAEFLDYREHSSVFEDVIGGGREDVLLATDSGTEAISGGFVTSNTFNFLRVPAALGRSLLPDDGKPDAPSVFVMSHKMWQSRYAGDPAVIGRSFVLNGVPTTLVGIMPPRFTRFAADIWRPVKLVRGDPLLARRLVFQGRLKRGVTLEQASRDLDEIAHGLASVYPRNYSERFAVRAVSWVDSEVGQFRLTLYTLAMAVGFLLLIACSNVANMLLATAAEREKEMAVRMSVGATRWRVVRQLLVESAYLASAGAVIGCLFALLGIKALLPFLPVGLIPPEVVIRLSMPVLVFALALTVLTTIACGLVPALQTLRRGVVKPLREVGRGNSGGSQRRRLQGTLVVIEVALSLVLLLGAALLMRTVIAYQRVELGFDTDHLLLARVTLPRGAYDDESGKRRFFESALQRLNALRGVVAAAETTGLPPYGGIVGEVDVTGQIHDERWNALLELCSEGYFQTLGVRVLRGQPLSHADVIDARRRAVVNEAFVNQYMGQTDPIGRHVRVLMLADVSHGSVEDPIFEIVGVTSNVKNRGLHESPMPQVFIPYTTTGAWDRALLIRTAGDPRVLLTEIQEQLWAVDRTVALGVTATLNDYLKLFSYSGPRFGFIVLGAFATVGLLLVLVGVSSVLAYSVSQRTHEIGIRMVMGATRASILRLVMRSGIRLLALGVILGVLGSLGAAQAISRQLWGVAPYDPVTLISVVGVLLAAGIGACYVPARKATLVDPMRTLQAG